MIPDLIAFILSFYIETPVFAGILTGAIFFGAPIFAIGWSLGHDAAMRKVGAWMRPKAEDAHGDVPMLPPVRERRFSAISHREWLS
jgi:hypothetical protein